MFDCLNNGLLILLVLGSLVIAFTLGLGVGINSEQRFKRRTVAKDGSYFQRQYREQEE